MARIDDLWPLYRLRLRVGEIELRLPDDDDLAALAELSSEPIHDPAIMPFTVPWSDVPGPERARSTLQWSWRARAGLGHGLGRSGRQRSGAWDLSQYIATRS